MSVEARIIHGDCIAEMAKMPPQSVDTIVTDPPYHLTQLSRGGSRRNNNPNSPFGRHRLASTGFAGKDWDGGDIAFRPETWEACLRVAKPGAYLLAFSASRTFHHLFCAIEDAGWIIQDTLMWVYSTGLPKALNVSKSLDKKAGAERTEVVGRYQPPEMEKPWGLKNATNARTVRVHYSDRNDLDILAPATEDAKLWDGYATALKPSFEPICLAMKPLDGTYAENALKHGVAGLNIDGCRIAGPIPHHDEAGRPSSESSLVGAGPAWHAHQQGRWPANLLLDEGAAALLDAQTGVLSSGKGPTIKHASAKGGETQRVGYGAESRPEGHEEIAYGDSGGASRFFYCSKVAPSERGDSDHPTMKPIDLMRWLCRLTKTPTGGVVLDPFAGSGSTLLAARAEGRPSIGIDSDAHACEIAAKRLSDSNGREPVAVIEGSAVEVVVEEM